jgi:membrane associated rhomboid family serine protease
MFFILPIAVDYQARRLPVVTFTLMGLNATLFVVWLVYFFAGQEGTDPLITNLGLIPAEKTPVTWLTSMFVHGGFFHFIGNMIYLFLFGACVEDLMGRPRFSLFYFGGGLIANLSQVLLTTDLEADIPIVGASGAISACIGAFLIVLPRTKINFRYFGWLFFRVFSGEFWLPAWIVIAFWFLMDFGSLLLHLGVEGAGGGVAFGAHVGGTLAGLLAAWSMRRSLQISADKLPAPGRIRVAAPAQATSSPDEPATVYLWIDGRQIGPYAPAKVRAMAELGAIAPDTLFWQEGMADWRPLADL